jgi:hypothetical protein
VHQRLGAAPELAVCHRERQQAHAAVDVVPNAAGRDHPVGLGSGGHATDREAVALVDVGHGQRCVDDPGQRGHVGQLLQRAIAADRRQQLLIGEHARRHPHPGHAPDR